jgi:hypothetical protein
MPWLAWAALLLGDVFPAEMAAPPGMDPSKPWRLVREADGAEVPAQWRRDRIHFLRSGEGPHRVEAVASRAWPLIEARRTPDGVDFVADGRTLARYAFAPVPVPAGVDPVYSRGGYLHPLRTPAGRVVTNDLPSNHLHHHGIWSGWTSSHFEGRPSNFWETKAGQGRVEALSVDETWSGPACAGLRARHRFVSLSVPGAPKPALDETWEVLAWLTPSATTIDLAVVQSCASDSPVLVKEYRYGGIGFRGTASWEGKEGCTFLTSEGKGRVDGHGTRARWCVVGGQVDGAACSVGLLDHPTNPRYPTPVRIHPDEPFFNWAVPQLGDLRIEPGRPFSSKLRFLAADGPLPAPAMEAQFRAFASP